MKKLSSAILPHTASDEFAELVTRISKLHHPNLTELVGYCMEHGQHLLVYEFHQNGSLHDLLHVSDEYTKPLSWNSRVKIALGSARALEYATPCFYFFIVCFFCSCPFSKASTRLLHVGFR